LNSQPSTSNKIIFQDPVTDELTSQYTIPDIKYQDITYYKDNDGKIVLGKDKIPIDFIKATSEMNNLDWKYEFNYIGFENQKSNECVQFIRKEQDRWYAEVPIRRDNYWDGYVWCCQSDSKTILSMMRLFFEEVPWFGMLSWKMRRFNK